jgi:hypothetical protein
MGIRHPGHDRVDGTGANVADRAGGQFFIGDLLADETKYTNPVLNWSALRMSYHVMILDHGSLRDTWFFVGPFITEEDAWEWGKQQDVVHPSWHVLDLDDPTAQPQVSTTTIRTPATGGTMRPWVTGQSGIYILYWRASSYHLIGPFNDDGQCIESLTGRDVHPYFDPRGDYGWTVLRLDLPPSPQVLPPTMTSLSEDEMQQRRMRLAQEDELFASVWRRNPSG